MRQKSVVVLLSLQLLTISLAQQPVLEPPRRSEPPIRRDGPLEQKRPQAPQPRRPVTPASDESLESAQTDDVVRITTNLVQVDAIVTDKKGKTITDLRLEDFEILENGRPQPITNFSFIDLAPASDSKPNKPAGKQVAPARNVPPLPAAPLRAEQVHRTIAFVVDDLFMSFASVQWTKDAMTKFVREQMQPGDLVAIIRVSSGIGALEQFTNNKDQLMLAIKRLRWQPRPGTSAFAIESVRDNSLAPSAPNPLTGRPMEINPIFDNEDERRQIEQFREQVFTSGTLGALNYVVRGLKDLPGRKAVALVSDGFTVRNPGNERGGNLANPLKRLVDLANRSAVTFYTFDPRGLLADAYMWTASDNVGPSVGSGLDRFGAPTSSESLRDQALTGRMRAYSASQGGPNYLANETGGLFDINFARGLKRMMEDQRGYYLIGYRPNSQTFSPRRLQFHQITVRVKRPDLKVRSRTGFYNLTDEVLRNAPRAHDEKLLGALMSPFSAAQINVRLTTLFVNHEKSGSFMRSLLHLDPKDLTFTADANGGRKVSLDVAALTFGEAGRIVDAFNRTYTIRVTEPMYKVILRRGLSYEIVVPVKKPGPYQLRIALRDTATDRLGSVGQFIEVPDLSKHRLNLSGLLLGNPGEDAVAKTHLASATPSDNTAVAPEIEPDTAVRRIRLGTPLDYSFVIYNAKLDKTTSHPQLLRQVRLFRDGRLIHTAEPQRLDIGQQKDLKRILITEQLQISGLTAGQNVLQIVITDLLANGKHQMASQWIDFELVR